MSLPPPPATAAPGADTAALALLGDAVGDAVLLGDADLVIAHANLAARRLLGAGPGELVGRRLEELVPAHARTAFAETLAEGGEFVLDADAAAAHPLAGRRCRIQRLGDAVALVVAPDVAPSISDVVRQLNQTLEYERIVKLVADHAVHLLRARRATVFVLEGDDLVTAGSAGFEALPTGTALPLDATFSGTAVRALRPMRLADTRAHAERWPRLARDGAGDPRPNAVAAPLVIGGRPIGAVCVAGREDADFDAADERLLAKLADHAAIAVENARLFGSAARTARHASILAETAHEIARHVTTDAMYAGVARVALQALRAAGVRVYRADEESYTVEVVHGAGTLGAPTPYPSATRFWASTAGRVARSGEPCFVPDIAHAAAASAGAGHEPVPADEIATGALALLPLPIEGGSPGVLALHYARPQPFDDAERRLLGDFAMQATVGMRHASLISTLERKAARLAALANAQSDIPGTCLDDVYAELHGAVGSVVDASAFALLLAEEGSGRPTARHVVVDGHVLSPATLEATHGTAAAAAAAADAMRLERPVFERPPLWSWSAAAAPEPGREWRPAASGLAVPVRHGGRVLGALHVQSRAGDAYGTEDADLLAIVAGHAGAALELARLFALQQRERVLSEASAEIARLALGDDDLPSVAGRLLGVVDGVVPAQAMVLAALIGADTVEYVAGTGAGTLLAGARVPFAESLLARLGPGSEVVLPDIHAAITPAWRPHAPDGQAVLIPLVARQRVIGMLGVATARGQRLHDAHVAELRKLAASVALAVDALLLAEEERRRTEREREMAAALATMDQPVILLDLDGRVRSANVAAEREYGYAASELTGMHVSSLAARAASDRAPTPAWGMPTVPDADASGMAPGMGRLGAGRMRVAEEVHRRRDGSEFPASVTRGTIRDDEGRAVGHVLGVRNLTDERRVAEQLRQHEKLAALGSLVAGVAHELNNPLTGISAFSQLLLEEGLGDEQSEAVRLIKREADRAVGVIRDLLLFSRKAGTPLGEVDVNAVLRLAVRLRTYTLRAERIEVALDLDESAPLAVGDEQRLQQVFLNLIVNAEHALIGREERRLTLRTCRTGAHLVVEVCDTGSGMDAETQAHVFEPFFTTKPAGTGTGLGLSVSYGIVQAHGGAITVESDPGLGSTFRITLPLARRGGQPEHACP